MRLCPAILAFAALATVPAPAMAELPPAVRDMIVAAIETGDKAKVDTIVAIARQTNPDESTAIDALVQPFAAAQEAKRKAAEEEKQKKLRSAGIFRNWKGRVELGAYRSDGNTDAVGLTTSLKLDRKGVDWTHKVAGQIDYRRNSGKTDREKFFFAYEPRYEIGKNLFTYGLAQFERDRIQGYAGRYAISGGLGHKVIDEKDVELSIKAGPAYRKTDFLNGESEESLAALFGVDFDWRLNKRLTLTQDTNLVTESGGAATVFLSSNSTTLNLATGLEAKVSDRLSTRFTYTVEYDSDPVVGKVGTDTHSRFSLVYGF